MTNFRNLKQLAERLQALQGKSVVVGVLSSNASQKEEGNDITLLEKAVIHEFGVPTQGIPERSFLRSTFSEQRSNVVKILSIDAKKFILNGGGVDVPFANAGRYLVGKIQDKITAGIDPVLASETIKRKGSSKPLIDTGQLVGGINYEVRDES